MEGCKNFFNTLILLVGTNPLPNFVVAEYFLINNPSLKNLLMIYSEDKPPSQRGTKGYVDSLQKLLQNHHKERDLTFNQIPLSDISDAKEIERDLKKRLTEYLKQTDSIHINYTGGTKAMGIHIYRWLENYGKEKNIPISFSYLDARTFQIVDDKYGRITGDLRSQIKLSIQELISLHGFKRDNEDKNEKDLFKVAVKKFREIIEMDKIKDYFNSYRREYFTDEKGELLKKVNKLKEKIEKLGLENKIIAQGTFLEIVNSMPEDYKLFNDEGSFKELKTNKNLERAIEFLDGKWLEMYVYDLLKESIKDKKISIDINWEIKKYEWSSSNQKFEIDVIIINGYQLIGISCTTSVRKNLCKSKGFEIFMRTRQIGGEEARAVLVTVLPESKKIELEQELEVDTGGKENILVLGIDDLKENIFTYKIKKYIE
ncbi:MAG: DUF1887 family CARF protein [Thermodesulfovibrio sp.]|nr:DUF1887 family CARF protein [Thermodesulfovibrio sp.]ODA44126.1 hypothetical protein THER_1152 [Thermodesulfovibrio sp. N1]